jgi:hypothetical protein
MRPKILIPLAFALAAPWPGLAQQGDQEWTPVPFRARNLTFPSLLVMGFKPAPVVKLAPGRWVVEIDVAASNNFQVSSGVETYLERRGGDRRPLDATDVQRIVATTTGDQFLVDGEIGLADVGIHYGLTETLALSLHLAHLSYGGGVLDPAIWDFHHAIGIGQSGRQYVEDDRFQLLFVSHRGVTARLDRPTSGGFMDPVLGLRWILPATPKGWRLGLEAGIKAPLASHEDFLSTGSFDLGAQLSAHRQWPRDALILNLAMVWPGTIEITESIDVPHLPSLNLAWVHRLGARTSAVFQVLFSENLFRELTDSDLAEMEFQLTAGLGWDTFFGRLGVGVTENLFNYDNTPDFAVHLNLTCIFGGHQD